MITDLRKALPGEKCNGVFQCEKPAIVVFRRWETMCLCEECAKRHILNLTKAIEDKSEERAKLLELLDWKLVPNS
jgi:hypothetical protein